MKSNPITTVDVTFINTKKDKTLLFKRENKPLKGVYFTIGGRLWKNETFIQSALRHAKKELGLRLNPKKLIFGGVSEELHPDSIFPGISYHAVDIFFYYVLDTKNLKLTFDSQHNHYKWFNLNDIKLHPMLKKRFKNNMTK